MEKSLLDIVSDTNKLIENLIESGGELTEEVDKALAVNEKELSVKTDSYAYILDRFDTEESFWKHRASQIADIAKGYARARDHLKDRLKYALSLLESKEIKGNEYRFKLAATQGKVVIQDAEILPAEYTREVLKIEPDKVKIKDALKRGIEVPGAYLDLTPSLKKYVNKESK